MTRAQFAKRQALIAAGYCPRCAQPVSPWPIHRADRCHPAGAVACPRHWGDITQAEARITIKER